MSRTCDIIYATDHIVRSPRPSPSVFSHYKNWKQGWLGAEASEGWFLSINEFTIIICAFVSIDKGDCKVDYGQMGMPNNIADG